MSVTLQAAVHLGQDYTGNLRSIKNQPFKSVRLLFQTTERLITDQMEITGLSTIDWKQPMWRETTLLCDGAVQIANSQTYVFFPTQYTVWETSVTNQSNPGKTGSNGFWKHATSKNWLELTESRWNSRDIFPGFTTLAILAEIQNMMAELKCDPDQFQRKDHLHVDI